MDYQLVLGNILFSIHSQREIPWKKEDLQFFFNNQPYSRILDVDVLWVDAFSREMCSVSYQNEEIRFGEDQNGNEIRIYKSRYRGGRAEYAMSMLCGNQIRIEFLNRVDLWNTPGIRIWSLLHMERLLLDEGGFVFHCCYLTYGGKAILFTAPSGTGKTTQGKLWERLYPSKILNGDKALVRKQDGIWYACGYPFHGSALECKNMDCPIAAIVVVRQNRIDQVTQIPMAQKVGLLYSEATVNLWDTKFITSCIDLLSDLVYNVPVVKLDCTMNDEACHTLHRYLKENIYGTI